MRFHHAHLQVSVWVTREQVSRQPCLPWCRRRQEGAKGCARGDLTPKLCRQPSAQSREGAKQRRLRTGPDCAVRGPGRSRDATHHRIEMAAP